MAQRRTFSDEQKDFARTLLRQCNMPRDQLPYTDEFEVMYVTYGRMFDQPLDRNQFWRLLGTAGKKGGLAKTRRTKPSQPNADQV